VAGDANDDVYWFFLSIVISSAKPFVLIRCCHSIDQYFQSILNSFIFFFFWRPGSQVSAGIDKTSRFAFRQRQKQKKEINVINKKRLSTRTTK